MSPTTRVAVVLHVLKNQPFGEVILQGLREVLEGQGFELAVYDPEGHEEVQVRMLEAVLASQPAGLILSPIGASVRPALRRIRKAGIRVVAVDNDLGGDPGLYDACVVADNRAIGRTAGTFLAEVMDGAGRVVEVLGTPSRPSRDRSEGLAEAIAPHPGLRVVDRCTGDWMYDLALDAFQGVLLRQSHIDAVFAHNDEMARAALHVAEQAGRGKESLIVGVDAIPGALGVSLVSQGKLAASCLNPPSGRAAAHALLALLHEEPVEERVVLKTSILRSNLRVREWQLDRRR